MLGVKLKELRESNGLVQRQIAALLEVDTAFISKVEKEEKQISKNHIGRLAKLFKEFTGRHPELVKVLKDNIKISRATGVDKPTSKK